MTKRDILNLFKRDEQRRELFKIHFRSGYQTEFGKGYTNLVKESIEVATTTNIGSLDDKTADFLVTMLDR